jgi:outer membrane receptor for monomeric catechols
VDRHRRIGGDIHGERRRDPDTRAFVVISGRRTDLIHPSPYDRYTGKVRHTGGVHRGTARSAAAYVFDPVDLGRQFEITGEQVVRGVELGMTGRLGRQWTAIAKLLVHAQ